jgi:nicotinamide-nucleotide amidase
MTENNRRQAFVPEDAVIIENPVGTAPSFAVEYGDKAVISLPGVPREMKYLMIERVVPYLRQRYGITGKIIKAKILKAAGIGESALDELIGNALLEASNPTVGLAAHSGQIDVRITAKAESTAEADALIAAVEAQLREHIESYIFGVDTDTIEQALVAALREQDSRVTIGEIGVDPLVSSRLQAAPGGREVVSAVVTYPTPDALEQALGIGEALPLRQLAERAAEELCKLHNSQTALVILSNPAVLADQADSVEGSAIAVCVDGNMRSRGYGFGGGTDTAREWTGTWTMSMAWRMLRERIEANKLG